MTKIIKNLPLPNGVQISLNTEVKLIKIEKGDCLETTNFGDPILCSTELAPYIVDIERFVETNGCYIECYTAETGECPEVGNDSDCKTCNFARWIVSDI